MPKNGSDNDDDDDENVHNNTIDGHDDIDNRRNEKHVNKQAQVHPTEVIAVEELQIQKEQEE